jgi:electron transfer flavoprotein beta subunit
MKARSKPLETLAVDELELPDVPVLEVSAWEAPPPRTGGRKVADVAELVAALRERGAL